MKKFLYIILTFQVLFSYQLKTQKGWQLKGALEDIDVNLSFKKNEIISVWTYENNKWKAFFNKDINISIESLKIIHKEDGFWILSNKNTEINTTVKSPYSLEKFQPVLNESKLQAPLSSYNPLYSVKYGEFKDYYNKYFYLTDNKYMTFYMCDEHHRSELRFKNTWEVNSSQAKILEAKVKILPLTTEKEFTFLQIHSDTTQETLNEPLLRIVWINELKNLKNHIWAVVKTDTLEDGDVLMVDLGELKNEFFDIKIKVYNSKLSILVDNKTILNNFDISFWKGIKNYFKLGVYLQSNGCAKALFDTIKVID